MDKFMEAFLYVMGGFCTLSLLYLVYLLIVADAVLTLCILGAIVSATVGIWLVIR